MSGPRGPGDPHIDWVFAAIVATIIILGVALIVYAAARG